MVEKTGVIGGLDLPEKAEHTTESAILSKLIRTSSLGQRDTKGDCLHLCGVVCRSNLILYPHVLQTNRHFSSTIVAGTVSFI